MGVGAALCAYGSLAVAAAKAPAPELRAFLNESCVLADEPWLLPEDARPASDAFSRAGPLTALVVGKLAEVLISHSIKATAGRISASAERKDTRYAFARETNLYRAEFVPQPALALNARLGCITLVAGRFASVASCHEQYVPRTLMPELRGRPESEWRSTRTDDSTMNVLRRSDICTEGAPRSVYEARFEFSPDGTAWRLIDAGYRVDSLLAATGKRTERNVFYTLEVLQPSGTAARGDSLTTGMVSLGTVRAGAKGDGVLKPGAWLRVPALSVEARRTYEQRTAVHLESWAEIGALERALARNDRILAEVRQKRQAARGELARGLVVEENRLGVQRVTLQAELAARREEYATLPRQRFEFMPVAIEVGLTETKSDQPALLAMAEVMKQSSGFIGATAGQLAAARSVSAGDEADPGTTLARARDDWHDARVAHRFADTAEAEGAARTRLASSREAYRDVRMQIGLGEPGQ